MDLFGQVQRVNTAGSLVSNATGVSETAAPLGSVEWTGRDNPAVSYTWVGFTDGTWNTASNWNPSGIPSSSDAVTLTNGSTGVAADLSLTGSVSVNALTFNGTGNFFTIGAGATFKCFRKYYLHCWFRNLGCQQS